MEKSSAISSLRCLYLSSAVNRGDLKRTLRIWYLRALLSGRTLCREDELSEHMAPAESQLISMSNLSTEATESKLVASRFYIEGLFVVSNFARRV